MVGMFWMLLLISCYYEVNKQIRLSMIYPSWLQLYCTPESDSVGLCCCDVSAQGDKVFAGQSNGELVLLDLRMRSVPVKSLHAHERAVKSVHINPVHDHLMLSASSDM